MIRILFIGRTAARRAHELNALDLDDLDVASERLPAAGVRAMENTPPDAIILLDEASSAKPRALVDAIRARPLGSLAPLIMACPDDLAQDERDTVPVDAWLDPHAPITDLAQCLARLLDLDLRIAPADLPDAPPLGLSTHTETEDYLQDFSAERLASLPQRPRASTVPLPVAHLPEHRLPTQSEAQRPLAGSLHAPPTMSSHPRQSHPEPDLPPIVEPDLRFDQTGPRKMTSRDIFGARHSPEIVAEIAEPELRRKLRAVRHEDYFAILDVPRGAETPIIRDAFQRAISRWHRDRIDFDLAHRYQAELLEIRDALEDAWAVLGDSRLRDAYLQQTTRL